MFLHKRSFSLFKARFNREFRKLYSYLPCIDASQIDGELTDTRTNVPLLSQTQLRRLPCQQYSPNSSCQQRSRQNTTTSINSIQLTIQSSPISIANNLTGKRPQFFFSNRPQNRLLKNNMNINNNNNYYYCSSRMNRSINNCEKFLNDQDLTNSSKENDLLLNHANPLTRFS